MKSHSCYTIDSCTSKCWQSDIIIVVTQGLQHAKTSHPTQSCCSYQHNLISGKELLQFSVQLIILCSNIHRMKAAFQVSCFWTSITMDTHSQKLMFWILDLSCLCSSSIDKELMFILSSWDQLCLWYNRMECAKKWDVSIFKF